MPKNSDIRLAVHIAATCSLGAAVIHAVVAAPHWEEWWLAGLFFAGLAAFQCVWAVAAVAAPRSRWLVALAVPVNLGAAVLWAVSRFSGTPAGPAAGSTEAIGVADLGATLLGILTALLALWVLVPRAEHATLRKGWYAGVLTGAALSVALVAAPGVMAGPEHSHEDGTHGKDGHHESPGEEDGHHDPAEQPTAESTPLVTTTPTPSSSPTAEAGYTDAHDAEPHSH